MRAEVPDDADVALVQAEVDPARGDEVDLAELTPVEELLDGPDRRAVEERVAAHQDAARLVGEGDQLVGHLRSTARAASRRRCACRRSRLGGRARQWVPTGVAIRTASTSGSSSTSVVLGGEGDVGVAAPEALEPVEVLVADPLHLHAAHLDQDPQEVRPPVAEADHRHHQFPCRGSTVFAHGLAAPPLRGQIPGLPLPKNDRKSSEIRPFMAPAIPLVGKRLEQTSRARMDGSLGDGARRGSARQRGGRSSRGASLEMQLPFGHGRAGHVVVR